jgi:hypothetical protein
MLNGRNILNRSSAVLVASKEKRFTLKINTIQIIEEWDGNGSVNICMYKNGIVFNEILHRNMQWFVCAFPS